MADAEIVFGSNLSSFLSGLRTQLSELEGMVQQTAGTINSVDFGDQVLVHFQATMAKMVAEARSAQEQIRVSTSGAITAASPAAPYRTPAAGAYQRQENEATQGVINAMRQATNAYIEQFPRLAPQLENLGASAATEELQIRKQINDTNLRGLRALRDAQVAGGVPIPRTDVIARGAINGPARVAEVFNPQPFTDADAAAYKAEIRTARAAELRAAKRQAAAAERAAAATDEAASATAEDSAATRGSASALKGWATRRANAASKAAAAGDSSAVAVEETAAVDRAAAEFARRSAASRKGWETRQANANPNSQSAVAERVDEFTSQAEQEAARAQAVQQARAARPAFVAAQQQADADAVHVANREAIKAEQPPPPIVGPTSASKEEEASQKRGQLEETASRQMTTAIGRDIEHRRALTEKWASTELKAADIDLERATRMAQQALRVELTERKAQGTAFSLPGGITGTVPEGDFYKNLPKGGAEQLSGVQLAETKVLAAQQYNNDEQKRGFLAARGFAADERLTETKRVAAESIGKTQIKALRLDDEATNATRIATAITNQNAARAAGLPITDPVTRAGSFYRLGSEGSRVYEQTAAGAKVVESQLRLVEANELLAKEEIAAARLQSKGFLGSFVQGATSRSAFGGGAGATAVPLGDRLGGRLGSLTETFAGFALLGGAIKAISDTKNETVAYITALTNLEVRMQHSGAVTAGFTNDLEGLSRLAGSNVSDQLDAAARAVSAFGDAGTQTSAQLRQIGEAGATAASQLAVISGTDLTAASNNMVAIASSFGIAATSLTQVGDAVSNAKRLGGESAEITSGLAAVAGAAKEAGFNVQQAADLISLITARTNESGAAAATRLSAIFQLFGSHQSVLQGLGIDTGGQVKAQIEALAVAFPKLTAEQQKHTLSQLGGRTALRELLPLLNEQPRLQAAYAAALNHAGAGTDEFNRKNASLAGLFRKIGGDITAVQLNLERSGIFNDIGIALKAIEPGLHALSDVLGVVDQLVEAMGPLGALPGILLDTYLALKLMSSLGRGSVIAEALLPGLAKTGALPPVLTRRVGALAPKGAGAAADAAATNVDTAANEANTAAKAKNAAATARAAEAEAARTAAMGRGIVVTDAQAASIVELQAAIDLEALALADLAGAQDLELKIQGSMVGANEAEAGSLQVLAAARQEQIVLLNGMAEAQTAAARAALAEAEAQSAASAANRSGFLGLGIGNRVKVARAANADAAGAEGAAAGGSGLARGFGGIAVAAVAGDLLFNSINAAAKKSKASLDDAAVALEAVAKAAKPDDISNAAAQLRSAAAERAKSTSGIVGSTEGFLRKYLGDGSDSNKDAKNLRDAAKIEDAQAKANAADAQKNADLGNPAVFEGAPNSIDAITKAFKLMDDAGDRATTKMLALNAALGGLPGTGSGPGHILPGGGSTLGQQISTAFVPDAVSALTDTIKASETRPYSVTGREKAAANTLLTARSFDDAKQNEFDTIDAFASGKDLDLTRNKQPLANAKGLAAARAAVQKKIQDLVTQAGLDSGGVITDAMATDFGNQIAALFVDPNETPKQLAKTRAGIAQAVHDQALKFTDPSKIPVDQTASNFIQQQEIPFAQAAGTESLGATDGDRVKAAQAVLDAQRANNAAALATKDSTGKHNHLTQQAIDATTAAEFGLADALQQRAATFDELAKSQLAADDAVGRASIDVKTALDKYTADVVAKKPPDIINADLADLNAKDQARRQALTDQQDAKIIDAVPANNATAAAIGGLNVAKNNLKRSQAPHDSKAYGDAVKAVDDAKLAVLQAKLADTQATIRAGANPNNQTGLLKIAAGEAKTAYDLIKKSHAGAKEVADAYTAMHAAVFAFLQSQLADEIAKINAGVDQTSKTSIANAAKLTASLQVGFDKKNNVQGAQLYNDITAQNQANAPAGGGPTKTELANDAADAAVKVGDSYGEAYTQYLDMVRTANDKTGAERAKLLRDAAVQKVVAEKLAVDIAHGARVNQIDPRDELALLREALRNDQAAQKVAGQPTEQLQQEVLQGKQDALALAQGNAARNAAKLASTIRQGEPLAAAAAALTDARANLKLDEKGTLKYFTDLAALHQAAVAYAQAFRDRARENLLLAGDTTDPVTQARADLASATAKLNDDRRKKTGDLRQDQLNKETAEQAVQKAQFDQALQQQQTAYGLGQESAGAFMTYLKTEDQLLRTKIAAMKKGQEGYQQYVDELNTIDQAIQGLNNQLSGQFNLGDIKLPTVYEVRRQVAATAAGVGIDNNTVQNINVTINGADFKAVVDYINSILGTRGSTVATTGKKAA